MIKGSDMHADADHHLIERVLIMIEEIQHVENSSFASITISSFIIHLQFS